MADHFRPTALYRELVATYLRASGIPGIKQTVPARSLAESFGKPAWFGDLTHDFKNAAVFCVKNEVQFNAGQALREAKATAEAASVDGSFVPYFTIQRRKADAAVSVGDSFVLTSLDVLAWLMQGNRIE